MERRLVDCDSVLHDLCVNDCLTLDVYLTSDSAEGEAHSNCGSTVSAQRGVILEIIPARVVGPTENVLVYAFLGDGSGTTMVNQELTDRLSLIGNLSELRVATITGSQMISGKMIALGIHSLDRYDAKAVERAYSVSSLQMMPQEDAV
ncbi:hypothetical protein PHET_04179 [Paragonimus heterotremus]|uniref:Uncharacterized protein n=1 Tax=Paragonimus heterotremus TaxID=100268 RepID=A0A8J4T1W1_9TREM|nr:hypothetical protein PHET_04179 [Paragonimus heterotremus]